MDKEKMMMAMENAGVDKSILDDDMMQLLGDSAENMKSIWQMAKDKGMTDDEAKDLMKKIGDVMMSQDMMSDEI